MVHLLLLLLCPNRGARLEFILDFADERLQVGIGFVGLRPETVGYPQSGHAFCTECRRQAIVLIHLEEKEEILIKMEFQVELVQDSNWNCYNFNWITGNSAVYALNV